MTDIPSSIISTFTFPGVVMHGAVQQLMCRLTGTPVLEVCYFQVATPCGYVRHAPAGSPWKIFLICVAPFLFNTFLAMFLTLPSVLAVEGKMSIQPQDFVLVWLGLSIGMHAIPSPADAKALSAALQAPGTPRLLKVVGSPATAFSALVPASNFIWFSAVFAPAICFFPPALWLKYLA